nr:unnamed protein product [Callosobruchus analis]
MIEPTVISWLTMSMITRTFSTENVQTEFNRWLWATSKDSKSPVVMVGGNSTIHGFDHLGNEIFWTPVGDILVVSSGNFNITVFKGDQRIAEHVETEVVTHLIALP